MSLRVYNSLTRQKELFEPVNPGKVGMYLCGPTVYKPPHIGHLVGPVIFDAIKRYLVFKGYETQLVVNITDVDDKLIDAAAKQKTTVKDLAEKHTGAYFDILKRFGVDTIDRFPKASEHIAEMIAMCQRLIEKKHAYAAEGNVWFDVASDPDYGKLNNREIEDQESGTRGTESAGKRNPGDFALWKAAKPGEPTWDSPWGKGRPGWHIECSAMSMKYLGETFDMHGGGLDLKFPHHENEIAQSECTTDKTFAKYWLHNGLTRINTKKISGSDLVKPENADLLARLDAKYLVEQHGTDLVRYLVLSTHYRSPIEFSDEVIAQCRKGLATFTRLLERIERLIGQPLAENAPDMDVSAIHLLESQHGDFVRGVLSYKMKFLEMMDDDFNTAGAIASMHELAGEVNSLIERTGAEKDKSQEAVLAASAAASTMRKLLGILGLLRAVSAGASVKADSAAPSPRTMDTLGKVMQLLIALRAEARKDKNFALADRIRKGLAEIGITLEDRTDGTEWRA